MNGEQRLWCAMIMFLQCIILSVAFIMLSENSPKSEVVYIDKDYEVFDKKGNRIESMKIVEGRYDGAEPLKEEVR